MKDGHKTVHEDDFIGPITSRAPGGRGPLVPARDMGCFRVSSRWVQHDLGGRGLSD